MDVTGGAAGGTSKTTSATATMGARYYAILQEEKEHQQSTLLGHRDLLKAKLDSLQAFVDTKVRADDWMFEPATPISSPYHPTPGRGNYGK